MKRLILMRHADAQPEAFCKNDRERPLSLQGLQEIELIRTKLQPQVSHLSLVLCSNAKRSRQTLEGIRSIFPPRVEIIYDDRLYHAPPVKMTECLQEIKADHKTILLIGHNPGVSQWLELCLRAGHQADVESYVSTATAVIFEGSLEKWGNLKPSLMTVKSILKAME